MPRVISAPDEQARAEGSEFQVFPTEAMSLLMRLGIVSAEHIRVNNAVVEWRTGKRHDSHEYLVGVERYSTGNDKLTSGGVSEQLSLAIYTKDPNTTQENALDRVAANRNIVEGYDITESLGIQRGSTEDGSPRSYVVNFARGEVEVELSFDRDGQLIYIDLAKGGEVGAVKVVKSGEVRDGSSSTFQNALRTTGTFREVDLDSAQVLAILKSEGIELHPDSRIDFHATMQAMVTFDRPVGEMKVNEMLKLVKE